MKQILLVTVLFTLGCAQKERLECRCTSENVCILLINESNQTVEGVIVSHEKGIVDFGKNLEDTNCVSFYSPGENALIISVTLKDGTKMDSPEQYSEGGYQFTATIYNDRVEVSHD